MWEIFFKVIRIIAIIVFVSFILIISIVSFISLKQTGMQLKEFILVSLITIIVITLLYFAVKRISKMRIIKSIKLTNPPQLTRLESFMFEPRQTLVNTTLKKYNIPPQASYQLYLYNISHDFCYWLGRRKFT